MKIKVWHDFKLYGQGWSVDQDLVYDAVPATNQPDWEAQQKVFLLCDWEGKPKSDGLGEAGDCYAMLLVDGEYEIVEEEDNG